MSLSDILSVLETGAQIASLVPQSSSEGQIALLIIHATQSAEAAAKANAGRPIDINMLIAPPPIVLS
jgi:hypothetical protein